MTTLESAVQTGWTTSTCTSVYNYNYTTSGILRKYVPYHKSYCICPDTAWNLKWTHTLQMEIIYELFILMVPCMYEWHEAQRWVGEGYLLTLKAWGNLFSCYIILFSHHWQLHIQTSPYWAGWPKAVLHPWEWIYAYCDGPHISIPGTDHFSNVSVSVNGNFSVLCNASVTFISVSKWFIVWVPGCHFVTPWNSWR